MDKERVLETIRGMEFLAGRLLESFHGAQLVNNKETVMFSAEGVKNYSEILSAYAKILTEEFLEL